MPSGWSRFISAYQSITPLDHWRALGWPSALKLALIEHLRQRGDVLVETRAHRVEADRLASAIEAAPTVSAAGPRRRIRHSSLSCCGAHATSAPIATTLHRSSMRCSLRRGETMEDAIRVDGRHQAREQAMIANLITSLRLIAMFDWSEFFESVSLVEQVLQRDPAGVYSRMDFRSRDRYRHAVEELALPTGEAQLLVALKSVERARQVHVRTPGDRAAHVGHHLIGAGRKPFERSVAWQPDVGHRVRRLLLPGQP